MALSSEDIKQIKIVVREGLDDQEQKFEKKLTETKSEFFEKMDDQEQKFEKKLTETKSEFFEKIDPILKEVTTAREERPLLENRIEALEKISSENTHIITS